MVGRASGEVAAARCKGVEHQVCTWTVVKMGTTFPNWERVTSVKGLGRRPHWLPLHIPAPPKASPSVPATGGQLL